jgi:hypothetical protein
VGPVLDWKGRLMGPAAGRPRTFRLNRQTDVTGTSGTGDVAWGVEWPDGACALRWATERASSVFYGSIKDVEYIHCGHGATTIVWDEAAVSPQNPRVVLTLNCGCSPVVENAEQAGLRAFHFHPGEHWSCGVHGKTRVIDARLEPA